MKHALTVILVILILGLSGLAQTKARGPVRLAVRVFQVPAEQDFRVERPDGLGATFALQASGNVASRFPRGTVIVPTELARNAADTTIGATIGESVAFGSGDLVADHIQVKELRSLEFSLDAARPAEEARFEDSHGEGRTDDYDLRVEVLSGGPGQPLVRLRFDAGSSWVAGSLAGGMSRQVISAVAEVPESKLLLIGARGEKAVYFLAVCAVPR